MQDTQQQQAKPYFGKPEHQKNPAAANMHRPKGPNRQTNRPPRPRTTLPPTLSKPTRLHDASHQQTHDEDVFKTSNFAHEATQRETHLRETFQPTFSAITELSRTMYQNLTLDDQLLTKKLVPEMLDYYHTCLAWLRIISLKSHFSHPMTELELRIRDMIEFTSFNVLEPMRLYYLTFGQVTTTVKTHLRPAFPPLPQHQVIWNGIQIPGLYGPLLDAQNHNLYEEVPSIGIAFSALIAAQQHDAAHHGAWRPPTLPEQWTPTNNLLGYRPTRTVRQEALTTITQCGISPGQADNYPNGSGFNFELLNQISTILSTTQSFKVSAINFYTITQEGSPAQLAQYQPQPQHPTQNIRSEVQIVSYDSQTPTMLGIEIAFAPRYYKQSDLAQSSLWACAQPPNNEPIPQPWFDNRNERRNMRDFYNTDNFRSLTVDAQQYRQRILDTFRLKAS